MTSGDTGAEPVHRLRDLDRQGRVWAGLFATALLLAPVLAFAWAAPDWSPAGDPALMGIRALDVGTSRTPLVGQPSTSGFYDGGQRHVAHPGPLHFYLLALPVRLLGSALGMLVVSVLVTGGAVLVAAWAAFRQLGPSGGALASVALALVTFTTGASSLVNPVSSNIAGYPVLCSIVLLWCLACGDLRLLPLTTVVVSFAAQQHLSALPALVVVAVAAVATGVIGLWRGRAWLAGRERRALVVWGGGSAAIGLVLWSPVLLQQVTGDPGNLSAMVRFAGNGDRPSLGLGAALRQLAHTLGLPPMLGQPRLDGGWLLADVGPFTWVSALVVAAAVSALGLRWRRAQPRRAALALVAGFVAVGGLVNGSNVPAGMEQYRLVFYHWAVALAFLVALTLGLAATDLARRQLGPPPAWRRPAAAVAALAAIVVPSAVNPALDRPTNTLAAAYSPVERRSIDRLADGVLGSGIDTEAVTLLYARDDVPFVPLRDGLALELTERGFAVRHPPSLLRFVDDERLADPDEADRALVLQVDDATPIPHPEGELVAEIDLTDGFDWDAYEALAARSGNSVPLGRGAFARTALEDLRASEPALVGRVLETMPDVEDGSTAPLRVRVYLLSPRQLAAALEADDL